MATNALSILEFTLNLVINIVALISSKLRKWQEQFSEPSQFTLCWNAKYCFSSLPVMWMKPSGTFVSWEDNMISQQNMTKTKKTENFSHKACVLCNKINALNAALKTTFCILYFFLPFHLHLFICIFCSWVMSHLSFSSTFVATQDFVVNLMRLCVLCLFWKLEGLWWIHLVIFSLEIEFQIEAVPKILPGNKVLEADFLLNDFESVIF